MDMPADMNRCNPQNYLVITNQDKGRIDSITHGINEAIRMRNITRKKSLGRTTDLKYSLNSPVRKYTPKRFLALNGLPVEYDILVALLGVSEAYLKKKLPFYMIRKGPDIISFEYREEKI